MLCSLGVSAQQADTLRMINFPKGMRCLVAHITPDGGFGCDFEGHYYPYRINDTTIYKWFVKMENGDSLFSYRTDSVYLYIWSGRPKNQEYGYQSEEMHNTGYGETIADRYTTDTIRFKRQVWREHIKNKP